MALAITANSVKIYPLIPETALRATFEQVCEFVVTAANSDTAVNLGTVAAAMVSGGSAQQKLDGAAIVSLLGNVSSLHSTFILESARAAAAATTAHTVTGTAAAPVFTFAGGGTTPTTQTYCLTFRLANDKTPVVYNV